MKQAVCCKCGKVLIGFVPDDVEEVTCFKCDQKAEAAKIKLPRR